jgi:hypothetical protein
MLLLYQQQVTIDQYTHISISNSNISAEYLAAMNQYLQSSHSDTSIELIAEIN